MRKEELIDKDTALRLCEEIKELAVSAFESISESETESEVRGKLNCLYHDLECLYNQKSGMDSEKICGLEDHITGHTKYLQGIYLPIMINSIRNVDGLSPSAVSEMHVGTVSGEQVLLITPFEIL